MTCYTTTNMVRLSFIIFSALFLASPLFAAPERAITKDAVDALLVLDSSGSMLQTDPKRLRDQGTKLFTQFLKEEDRFGVLEFSDTVKLRRPLKSFNPIEIAEIDALVASVGSSGYFTDMVAGLREAKAVLERDGLLDSKKVIVLLSDGKIDPDPSLGILAEDSLKELRDVLLPELKAKGILLYTLALSDQADRKLLAEAAEYTGGMSWYSASAEDIHKSFADLFLVVKKPQILPLTSKGFKVDGDVSEATFYINNEKSAETLTLQAPDGILLDAYERREGIQWFKGKKFDIITIKKPKVGLWKVLGIPEQDGYATVLTQLKLLTDWENSQTAGSPSRVQARLYEGKKPIDLPAITPVIRFLYQVVSSAKVSAPVLQGELLDNGEDGDKVPGDGVFSANITILEPGDYKLKVIARAPTFERSQQVPFVVRPRVIVLSLHTYEEVSPLPDGSMPPKEYFRVELGKDVLQMSNIEVQLSAVDEKRRTLRLPLKAVEGSRNKFEVPTGMLPGDGHYELSAFLSAHAPNGRPVKERSDALEYTKKTTEGEATPEVFILEEKSKPVVEEKPSSAPLFISLAIMLLGLGGVGAGIFLLQRKSQEKSSEEVADYVPSTELLSAIEKLQKAAAEVEVNFEEDIFQPEILAQVKRPESTTAAIAIAQSLRGQMKEGASSGSETASEDAEVQGGEEAGQKTSAEAAPQDAQASGGEQATGEAVKEGAKEETKEEVQEEVKKEEAQSEGVQQDGEGKNDGEGTA